MTKAEKRFRSAAKKAGVDVTGEDISAKQLAIVCGLNPSTVHRAVLARHIPARRRLPARQGSPMMISIADAVAYFTGRAV